MGFGKLVVGEEEYAKSKTQAVVTDAAGGFGPLVIGQEAYDAAHPKAEAAAPAAETAEGPVTEAYNVAGAIDAAKTNLHDLPRLLAVEMNRADGPRKTVLRAYRDLLPDADLDADILAAASEQIAGALGEAPADTAPPTE